MIIAALLFIFYRVVELTGDITPDITAVSEADIIVTTPEKWDGISRSWQNRNYVRDVSLIVIDEIHLLGTIYSKLCLYLSFFSSANWLNADKYCNII